ncbi:hypothetical protein [Corynebacterium phocae]|nr:hypothetical protein [Corynebacterium phocae]
MARYFYDHATRPFKAFNLPGALVPLLSTLKSSSSALVAVKPRF